MFSEYYASFEIIEDVMKLTETVNFLKIAVHHPVCSEKQVYPFVKQLKKECLIKISGQHWVDISNASANKGNALRHIQKMLQIDASETMVFGDYHNDIEMLQEAYFSFAMRNAHEDVKKIANFMTDSNYHFGVEKVLKKLIESTL